MNEPPEKSSLTSTLRPWERRLSVAQVLIWTALAAVFLAAAYPFFYVFSLAVMPYERYISQAFHLGPSGFTLDYFQQILSDSNLAGAFGVSVLKTLVGTTLNVLATVAAAWALSRRGLRLGRPLTLLFIVPLFVGGGLIPFFLIIQATGLMNSFWALILPGLVAPFNLLVARSYFQSYPQEVVDAATVDGAGPWTVLWRIVWPTSTPIIATMAVLYGVGHWNDYFWPSILVQPDLYPAQVVLQNMVTSRAALDQVAAAGQQAAPQSLVAAMAALMIVPVLVVYPFVQRYIVKGIMVGSVKG